MTIDKYQTKPQPTYRDLILTRQPATEVGKRIQAEYKRYKDNLGKEPMPQQKIKKLSVREMPDEQLKKMIDGISTWINNNWTSMYKPEVQKDYDRYTISLNKLEDELKRRELNQ
jgi:hypothetical protein